MPLATENVDEEKREKRFKKELVEPVKRDMDDAHVCVLQGRSDMVAARWR